MSAISTMRSVGAPKRLTLGSTELPSRPVVEELLEPCDRLGVDAACIGRGPPKVERALETLAPIHDALRETRAPDDRTLRERQDRRSPSCDDTKTYPTLSGTDLRERIRSRNLG